MSRRLTPPGQPGRRTLHPGCAPGHRQHERQRSAHVQLQNRTRMSWRVPRHAPVPDDRGPPLLSEPAREFYGTPASDMRRSIASSSPSQVRGSTALTLAPNLEIGKWDLPGLREPWEPGRRFLLGWPQVACDPPDECSSARRAGSGPAPEGTGIADPAQRAGGWMSPACRGRPPGPARTEDGMTKTTLGIIEYE